jgi:hypothetical protein
MHCQFAWASSTVKPAMRANRDKSRPVTGFLIDQGMYSKSTRIKQLPILLPLASLRVLNHLVRAQVETCSEHLHIYMIHNYWKTNVSLVAFYNLQSTYYCMKIVSVVHLIKRGNPNLGHDMRGLQAIQTKAGLRVNMSADMAQPILATISGRG